MSSIIMTLKTLEACLKFNISKDIATCIWGPPGVGKSNLVHQVADDIDYNLIDIRLSLRDPVDLRGLPLVDVVKGTTRWLAPSELPQEKRDGKKGILFLDEFNTCSKQMEGAALGLVLDRKLGEYRLPPGWIPIAAGNRLIDKASANRVGTATKNRYAHFEVVADVDAWISWASRHGIHPLVIGFVKFRPHLLHKMPLGDENAFPTPRAWETVSKVVDAPDAIRLQLVTAIVGESAAIEFEGFMQVYKGLPSIDQILTKPNSVHVPNANEVAACWAVSQALAQYAIPKNFGNAILYTGRLPKEFQVSMITDAVRRDQSLMKTHAFIDWATKNQEIVV